MQVCCVCLLYLEPSLHELKDLMALHGGRFVQYYSKQAVTHTVATNLPYGKRQALSDEKVVRPEWITDR